MYYYECVYDDNVNYVHGNNYYLLCVRNDFVYTFFYYYYYYFYFFLIAFSFVSIFARPDKTRRISRE